MKNYLGVISIANLLIDDYTGMTHDVFLTAFMGNNKRGIEEKKKIRLQTGSGDV